MSIASISMFVIVLLALAVIVIIVSILLYNRRLDRVVRGEDHDTHTSIPEPGTTVSATYKVILMGIVLISFFTISSMNGKISSLQNDIRSLQASQSQLGAQITSLEQQIEEQDRTVSSCTWEIVETDLEKRTADLQYTVLLKQFSDSTEVALRLGNRKVELLRSEGDYFTGQFTADLFGEYGEASLLITENGLTTTEQADFPAELFWDVLPMPEMSSHCDSYLSGEKMTCEGEFLIDVFDPGLVKKAAFTYMTGGKELKTLDVTSDIINRSWITIDPDLDLEGDLAYRIEIETKSGYVIVDQSYLVYQVAAAGGSYQQTMAVSLKILDKDGNLVWTSPEKY